MQYSDEFPSLENYFNWFKDDLKEELQYTGLKDKNSVEIYEGDIIEWYNEEDIKNKRIVIYEPCAFYAQSIETKNMSLLYGYDNDLKINQNCHIEVIGNIYENKEET